MSNPPEAIVQRYVAELSAYLSVRPRAADTVMGIACFWLNKPDSVREPALVAALELLVALGRLAKRTSADGQVLYAGIEQTVL